MEENTENSQRHEGVGDSKEKGKKTAEFLVTLVRSDVNLRHIKSERILWPGRIFYRVVISTTACCKVTFTAMKTIFFVS